MVTADAGPVALMSSSSKRPQSVVIFFPLVSTMEIDAFTDMPLIELDAEAAMAGSTDSSFKPFSLT